MLSTPMGELGGKPRVVGKSSGKFERQSCQQLLLVEMVTMEVKHASMF
jgi:hypothetical protein